MKTSALKSIIKSAVKEAIQEELKEIYAPPIVETIQPSTPTMSSEDKREAYKNILGETSAAFTSTTAQSFKPQAGMDVANGTLPEGEVDMSQIMGLMQK